MHIMKKHPHDLSILFQSYDEADKKVFLKKSKLETIAQMMVYLELEEALEVLNAFSLEEQQKLINMIKPDDAADIIQTMDSERITTILKGLKNSDVISKLITYDEEVAGAYMTTEIILLNSKEEVKEATKKVIKQANQVESIAQVFVVNEANKYIGAVSLKKLIKARTPDYIESIMVEYPFIYDDALMQDVYSIIRNYEISILPVLNHEHVPIGMITLDDALEAYHKDAVEDFQMLSALPSDEDEVLFKSAMLRIPWLFLMLMISIPLAFLTGMFEEIIVAVAILARFQPLILDASGDVATQTLAVTLRALSTNKKAAIKNGIKEILTGVVLGLLLGLIAAVIAYILALNSSQVSAFDLSLVVGISLWITVIIGPVFGFIIPVTLDKLGFDPAFASGPLITTFVDILSLFIFFGLASMILGGL